MVGFETRISGIQGDGSTSWASTSTPKFLSSLKLATTPVDLSFTYLCSPITIVIYNPLNFKWLAPIHHIQLLTPLLRNLFDEFCSPRINSWIPDFKSWPVFDPPGINPMKRINQRLVAIKLFVILKLIKNQNKNRSAVHWPSVFGWAHIGFWNWVSLWMNQNWSKDSSSFF